MVYRGIKGAGERTIRMTRALEQLENMGKGKEASRLKRKRGSCGGWSWWGRGHAIEDWTSIGETGPVKVPGKGWLKLWRVQVLDGIQTDTKYHWADGRPWQEKERP